MRTTLDLQDELIAKARRKAAEKGFSLTALIEEALRQYLSPVRGQRRRVSARWVVVAGKRLPRVDISDRDRLYDALEGRRP